MTSTSHLLFFHFIDSAPPQISTFPYTTLFRSPSRRQGPIDLHAQSIAGFLEAVAAATPIPAGATVAALVGDRKSTRLNSSHGSISYAVFCLKKKTHVVREHSRVDTADLSGLHY